MNPGSTASPGEIYGFTQLLTPAGWELLNALPPYRDEIALRLGEGLRDRGVDPALAAAALTQSRLRSKARAKFAHFADSMLFTSAGLEQATRLEVAALHARRFVEAGATRIADLGCGLGADSLAFAAAGLTVLAVDLDEMTAAAATVNLLAFPEVEVRHGDALTIDLAAEGVDAVFADPARRSSSGKRIFDPKAYSPPLGSILDLRHSVAALGAKVAPGIAHEDIPDDLEAQWISIDGDMVEAGLWGGAARGKTDTGEATRRSALVIRQGRAHRLESATSAATDESPRCVTGPDELARFLMEPDAAVIRSHLVGEVVAGTGGSLLDPTIAYITADAIPQQWQPFVAGYEILDVLPFGVKRLRGYLRERNVGVVTIKKRGTAVEPEALRKQLNLSGSASATVVLTRIVGKQHMLIVEPRLGAGSAASDRV